MKKYFIFILSIALSHLSLPLKAQKLSRTEKKIVAKVNSYEKEAIDFLEKVVNINSGTMNLEGVKAVGQVFDHAFKQIDFETRWIEMPTDMNRAGHFFASI